MKTKFINPPLSKDARRELRNEAMECLRNRIEDFEGYKRYGLEEDIAFTRGVPGSFWEKQRNKFFDIHRSFYDYGVERCYIHPHTFTEQNEGYYRFLLSTDGEEIRFHYSDGAMTAYKITFVYDHKVIFDVTNEDWAKWLFNQVVEV